MSVTKLSEINLCDLPSPLEIRVLRKWVPYVGKNERKQEVCYLFVDTNGYAIEAVADITKEKHFTSLINIGSTYTVDKYIAIPSRAYMPVVSHRTSLRMGNHTTFVPLLKESLPMYYYAFATANNIEITLWGEKADAIGHDISLGNILAVTSALVTKFKGVLQLESTNATTIVVNPPIPQLQMYVDRFKELGEPSHQQTTENQLTIEALKARGCTSYQVTVAYLSGLLLGHKVELGFMSTAQKMVAQTRLIRKKPHLGSNSYNKRCVLQRGNDRHIKRKLQRHDYNTRSQKFQIVAFANPKCHWSKKTSTR
ncbi:hypothetical protein E3N88_17189 [Mikania micrantha]|uniref:Uncharacterized protein n=1 Tax=Mikania micrantha TaxID=192012 RepID=A0A5N6NSY7_9ASTR|nr:hypothetical protein E3N88_17189 [Mikania micrantha]